MSMLEAAVGRAAALAAEAPSDEARLHQALTAIYADLFHVDFATYDVGGMRKAAPQLIDDLFRTHLALRGQVPAWRQRGLLSRRVEVALRDLFRSARYARDLLGELHLGHPRLQGAKPDARAFSGAAPGLLVNPVLGQDALALRPGDVVLQRGMVHNSAAIARIGDVDSQFSHIAMVARNAAGALVMVEAVIDEGSIVVPLDHALTHSLGRAVLFRHKDGKLAEQAAQLIHTTVVKADGHHRPRMLYDFSMELAGYDQLYCAKLVRLAYSMASDGAYRIPTSATRLEMRNRDFVERIGVTATETFAPGDMELECDFDLVAEWRDHRVTSELRLKDMIMTKLFEWMERYDFRFRPTLWIRIIGALGRLSSHLPPSLQKMAAGLTGGKVPPNMTARAIGAVAMLHTTAEELYKELRRLEDESIHKSGRQLHPREVLEALERLKAQRRLRIGYLVRKLR